MSDKLIAVEYCPRIIVGLTAFWHQLLTRNAIGEVLDSRLHQGSGKYNKQQLVHVRFPLNTTHYKAGWHANSQLNTRQLLALEGVETHPNNLFQLEKTPVSLYNRIALGLKFPDNLSGKTSYYSTHNLDHFVSMFVKLKAQFPFGWSWVQPPKTSVGSTFLEARFYSIETVVPLCNPSVLNGFAIEVTTRNMAQPWNDISVIACTNTDEDISFIDGVATAVRPIRNWSAEAIKRFSALTRVGKQKAGDSV